MKVYCMRCRIFTQHDNRGCKVCRTRGSRKRVHAIIAGCMGMFAAMIVSIRRGK